MDRRYGLCALAVIAVALAVSCDDIYTTSIGGPFERDSIDISSSTSVDDLIDIANSDSGTDPDVAKEVLDALGGKDEEDIIGLSVGDKTDILNLAGTAAVDTNVLTQLAQDAVEDDADTDALVRDALEAFDSTVNLDAVETVLGDQETLDEAPVESLVFASTALLASVTETEGSDVVMDIMADPDSPESQAQLAAMSPEDQDRMNLVIGVVDVLNGPRVDEADDVTFGDFNLLELLTGSQS